MKTFLKDCRWGRFLLLRGDMISIFADLYGEWSELELRLFRTFLTPDSNVVEVGANLGLHSVPLAKFASRGRIIASSRSESSFSCCAPILRSMI
jgi:hypothetical protein